MSIQKSEPRGKVLIVDDVEVNRIILEEILIGEYETAQAADGYEAIASMMNGELPDLVLLDIMMPEMDGFEVIAIMKNNPMTERIPIIFITASGRDDYEIKGLELGAADYITKPFVPEVVRLRVANAIELCRYRLQLEQEVEKGVAAITRTRENMLELLAGLVEHRDVGAGEHVKRTGRLVGEVIAEMLNEPVFRDELQALSYREIPRAALMHDIGKIGVSDTVLLKPGRLTEEEFEQIKEHPVLGGQIMNRLLENEEDIYYRHCKDICLHHHERWDGRGYPHGLKGEEIPLSARIVSVVDVYDALVSRRPYKEPFDNSEALRIIEEGSGTQFDPRIVSIFMRLLRGKNNNTEAAS